MSKHGKCTLPDMGGFVKDSNFHKEELLKVNGTK
jgi:hypothetical protein